MPAPEFIAQVVAAFVGAWFAGRVTFRSLVRKVNELCAYLEALRVELGHPRPAPAPLQEPAPRSSP